MSELNGKQRPKEPPGTIYCCQIAYGGSCWRSIKAYWADGAAGRGSRVIGRTLMGANGGSLLANQFNGFWCHALNLQEAFDEGVAARRSGLPRSKVENKHDPKSNDKMWEAWEHGYRLRFDQKVNYFVMMHDDVIPANGWIDMLYDDLISSGADLLAAVPAIKDPRGLTSTAIDLADGNRFDIERRITVHELRRLPTVFSAADCGYPDRRLLANTGLWIVRMDMPWLRNANPDGSLKLRFQISDKVARNPSTGCWTANVESEDWQFARDFQDMGGTIKCSSRIRVEHWGGIPFDNRGDWGTWKHDEATKCKWENRPEMGKEPEPEAPVQEIQPMEPMDWSMAFPGVRGWYRDPEGVSLATHCDGKDVLEIGSYCGLSTLWLSKTARTIDCVDTFDGRGTPNPGDTLAEFNANLSRHGDPSKVRVHVGTTEDVIPVMRKRFDAAFIDGDHSYDAVRRDCRLALSVLKANGTIVCHDYGDPFRNSGATNAVDDELLARGGKVIDIVGYQVFVDCSGIEREAFDTEPTFQEAPAEAFRIGVPA